MREIIIVLSILNLIGCSAAEFASSENEDAIVCDSWTGPLPVLDLTNECERACVELGFTAEQYPEELDASQREVGMMACSEMKQYYMNADTPWASRHQETAAYWLNHLVMWGKS